MKGRRQDRKTYVNIFWEGKTERVRKVETNELDKERDRNWKGREEGRERCLEGQTKRE